MDIIVMWWNAYSGIVGLFIMPVVAGVGIFRLLAKEKRRI